MHFTALITALWIIFWVYWLVSASGVKKNARRNPWWHSGSLRFFLLIIILLLTRLQHRRHVFGNFSGSAPSNPAIRCTGVFFCALGLLLAIWARVHLGRNWGAPMTVKEEPELITTGPYRVVRHPIYSGILVAMLGSALVIGTPWLIAFVFFVVYFAYCAKTEERLMTQQFPNEYPRYKRQTKMLIPFVW
jgi:protein-S-isoprenylcysteine O-methyltransferase Ste14